ncbi:MAG TPA: Asp-tRNA(Asn)/Glu-tRNA(Gln) amidotransferase subunit GatC [Firmicutes bacterium]|nr:Asp-tRNA(Asn)/Glu-tRNA(Gln) amidotransferase subunit GatC [Bacillota bacterium]
MRVTGEEIKAAAEDARLSFTPATAEALREKIRQVLEQVGEIKKACGNIDLPPLYYPFETSNTLRDDRRENPLPREKVLANGPETDTVCFHVPRIIEG